MRSRVRFDANTAATLLFVVLGVLLAWWLWDWYRDRPAWFDPVAHYMIHTGLKETARIAAFAVCGSAIVGLLLGTLLTIHIRPLQWLIRLYIEVWRGLPIIVTIFLMAFVEPKTIGIQWEAFTAAAVGLSLWGSAQVAEATRGAVQSIPREQHEAAAALGFGWVGRHAFVILPQALRRLLPPFTSLLVNVIQNTTIASIIGVAEVLESADRNRERLLFSTGDSHSFEIYVFVLGIFFLISFPLTRLARLLERRLV